MSRQEVLLGVLLALEEALPEVEGSLLSSRDGLVIASTLHPSDASRVAATATTVLGLSSRIVGTTGLGEFEETVIQSDSGTFVVYDAGDLATLAIVTGPGANLGLVHLEARHAAEELAHLLAAFREEAVTRARQAAVAAAAAAPPPAPPAPVVAKAPAPPPAPVVPEAPSVAGPGPATTAAPGGERAGVSPAGVEP